MRNFLLRFCRWALALLGLSSLDSCAVMYGSPVVDDPVCMYGTPTMEYRVSGKVTDSHTGDPIEGIQVGYDDFLNGPEMVLTTDDGEFTVQGTEFPSDKIKLNFVDVDGKENGLYMPEEVEVKLVKAESGDGVWFDGVYVADDVIVKLDADMPAEYGTPVVEFTVKGRVLDSDSSPVENLKKITRIMPMTQTDLGDGMWDYGDYQADNVEVTLKKK